MVNKESFMKVLQQIRKQEQEKRKPCGFVQSADFLINLRDFDLKRYPLNFMVNLPNKIKDKKIAGFLEKKSGVVDTITKAEFDNFKEKKNIKRLIKEYDFFIANAKLMPSVATSFGRVLGPAGKMPSPQLGVLMVENDDTVKQLLAKINAVVRIKPKEPSIKISIGKQSDKDDAIAENALAVYNEVFKNLPKQKENIRNVLIKFTMGKPVKVEI